MGDADGETPLLYACSKKNKLPFVKFLVAKGARTDVQTKQTGWNPVYVAATMGSNECLEYLIEIGVDVN